LERRVLNPSLFFLVGLERQLNIAAYAYLIANQYATGIEGGVPV
jgi:hypothetical protein